MISKFAIEGYDAYWDGEGQFDCPYQDTEEIIENENITQKLAREDWLSGWEIGGGILYKKVLK